MPLPLLILQALVLLYLWIGVWTIGLINIILMMELLGERGAIVGPILPQNQGEWQAVGRIFLLTLVKIVRWPWEAQKFFRGEYTPYE